MTQKDLQPDDLAEGMLERALTALEQDPSAVLSLSDADLASIVGGAYLKATQPTLSVRGAAPTAGGEENCGPGSCHSACNSWCHDFKV